MKFLFFICFAIGLPLVVLAEPLSITVNGGISNGRQLQCKAYLSSPTHVTQGVPKIIFSVSGTGAYTTYFHHSKNKNIYFLTIDKPGILPDFDKPGKPIVDRSLFDHYTLNTLVTCAQNALYWADDYLKNVQTTLILQGHSEGTVVLTNVISNLYADNHRKQLQNNVSAFFLSGAVVQPMSDVLAFQFKGKERKKLIRAYRTHDADFLYKNYQIGWAWLDGIFKGTTKLVDLGALAKSAQGRALPIELFQGLLDTNVPTKQVQKLVRQNQDKPANKQLNLRARYYQAGHELDGAALLDMQALHEHYLNHPDQGLHEDGDG